MNFLEETLQRLGVDSYSDLTDDEKKVYDGWLEQLSKDMTVDQVRNYLTQMINSITMELADEPEFIHSKIFPFWKRSNPKNVYLKARLKNYILLNAFMGSPQQAKEALESNLQQLKPVV